MTEALIPFPDRSADVLCAMCPDPGHCCKGFTGLCSIYEDRPQLCRDYLPGSGSLCVFHPDNKASRESRPKDQEAVAAFTKGLVA